MKLKYLLLVLFIPLLSSCEVQNNSPVGPVRNVHSTIDNPTRVQQKDSVTPVIKADKTSSIKNESIQQLAHSIYNNVYGGDKNYPDLINMKYYTRQDTIEIKSVIINVKPRIKNNYSELKRYANLGGIIAFKIKGFESTDIPTIKIYVNHKLNGLVDNDGFRMIKI